MSGVRRDGRCQDCGCAVSVVDYTVDPPPIPMNVPPAILRADGEGWTDECPGCGEWLDAEAILRAALEEGEPSGSLAHAHPAAPGSRPGASPSSSAER